MNPQMETAEEREADAEEEAREAQEKVDEHRRQLLAARVRVARWEDFGVVRKEVAAIKAAYEDALRSGEEPAQLFRAQGACAALTRLIDIFEGAEAQLQEATG